MNLSGVPPNQPLTQCSESLPYTRSLHCHMVGTTGSHRLCTMLMYNVMDSPIGIVPITRIAARDQLLDEGRAAPGNESKLFEKDIYGPKGQSRHRGTRSPRN